MMVIKEEHINYKRIEEAIRFLEANFQRQPELDEVADQVHLSPFHFQKIFAEWAGISPKRFLQYLTVDFLKSKLLESRNIVEAAGEAGLSSQSRVYDLFTTLEAVTPQEYKQKGSGIRIEYGFHETPFGAALIGATERGVCWLSFAESSDEAGVELERMKQHWNNSVFHMDENITSQLVTTIFGGGLNSGKKLNVLVKGTNFQVKVWEALLRLPMGSVTTYQHIAKSIDNANALQAVGSAVGANHIAYLIPCHRVIRKDGILGEYRWSPIRKKSMIGWEMAKAS
jgi:AraC family transcriptional regulator of adaptative response/methylated-DNA-[protein]-cysteine methyltransferase